MANPLEGIAYVQQQGELGRQRGTQNRLAQLASQAFGAAPADQRGLVQQAIAADPSAGFALNTRLGDDRQARMGELSQKARLLVGYAKAGNRAGVDALYPQLAAEAQAIGLAQGIPTGWDDSYLPAMEQLAQLGGGVGNVVHSQRIGEDGYIYNTMRDGSLVNTGIKADRQMWLRDHPGMAPHLVGKGGEILPVGGQGPAPVPGSPQTPVPNGQQFVDDSVALANQLIAAGIPAEQVDAFLQARMNPVQGQSASVPAPVSLGGGLARPSEAQVAAERRAAETAVDLAALPQRQAIETQGAIERTRGTEQAKAEAEQAAGAPKRIAKYRQALDAASNVETSINKALQMVGPMSTGFVGARLRKVEGTPAYNLASEIETIKANLGFDRLQQMRDNSPTGGALGAIAVQELVALQSTVANLDPNQSEEQLRENLGRIREHYDSWRSVVEQALQEEQQRQPAPSNGPSDGPAAPQASNRVLRYNPATGDFE